MILECLVQGALVAYADVDGPIKLDWGDYGCFPQTVWHGL